MWAPGDGFPVLRTPRTVLREIVAADAPALYAFRSDPEEQRHNDPPLTEPGQAAELVERLAREHRDGAVRWGLTLPGDGVVVGLLGYNTWSREHDRAEVGYDLARRLWGRGLAAEAMRAVLDFGFDAMGLNRISAHTEVANTRSIRMLERLGFRREGTLRELVRDGDAYRDVAVYAVLRNDRRPGATR